jgi:hypothetical protein
MSSRTWAYGSFSNWKNVFVLDNYSSLIELRLFCRDWEIYKFVRFSYFLFHIFSFNFVEKFSSIYFRSSRTSKQRNLITPLLVSSLSQFFSHNVVVAWLVDFCLFTWHFSQLSSFWKQLLQAKARNKASWSSD